MYTCNLILSFISREETAVMATYGASGNWIWRIGTAAKLPMAARGEDETNRSSEKGYFRWH